MRPINCFIYGCLLTVGSFVHSNCYSQLIVDFTMDQPGGCAPLITSFTSNISGASPSATVKWDFDNGNTSILLNPSSLFTEEKTYPVTLTVTDGQQVVSKTRQVTVFKKPEVSFSASEVSGCSPFPVTFTAKASADNGSIVSYLWDFGDGNTSTVITNNTTHKFQSAGKTSITLSATDNHGCTSTKVVENLIETFPGVQAGFRADKTFLCSESDPVQLVDQSISEKPLTYLWDFGDGSTSTEKSPLHVFNKKGAYTVKLTIESTDGCRSELVKTSLLHVANFSSEIVVPERICQDTYVEIKNISTPEPTSFTLSVDGIPLNKNFSGQYQHYFLNSGIATIRLDNRFGDCLETNKKVVVVNKVTRPEGFEINIPEYCNTPVTVNFRDTTPGAVKSDWTFNGLPSPPQATGSTVFNTYQYPGFHITRLTVTDQNGCMSSVQKVVPLPASKVFIQTTDNNGSYGCRTLTKKFKFSSDTEISSFLWHFGDGTTSTELEPEHTFGVGRFSVRLHYETTKGCIGDAAYLDLIVDEIPKMTFESVTGTTVCGNTTIRLKKSPEYPNLNGHYLINGKSYGGTFGTYFDFQVQDTGLYTISLIHYTPTCIDTVTRTDYIRVLPSFPKITGYENTCEGDRGTVTFSQNSRYATSWTWDFGDGTTKTYNTNEETISHQYSRSGRYTVVLTTTNGSCSNKDSIWVGVLLKQNLSLSSSKTAFCESEAVSLQMTTTETNPVVSAPEYILYGIGYEDNSTDVLPLYDHRNYIYQKVFNYKANADKTKGKIRLITTSSHFGCYDTTNFVPVTLTGARAGFEILNNHQCFGTTIQFRDTSSPNNTAILSRVWNFGDGKTIATSTNGIVDHVYEQPGQYRVTLTITDASGCSSQLESEDMVYIRGPKAAFTPSQTDAHLNSLITFYNYTNNFDSYDTQYDWDFGDGTKSTANMGSHIYTTPGTYQVKLVTTGPSTGCADTAYRTITVKTFNANFSIDANYLNSKECTSLLAKFRNTSSNFSSVRWDFGDGSFSENNNSPSHIYTSPGKYIVKLHVTGYNGLSKTYIDSIVIDQVAAEIVADNSRICTSQAVTFATGKSPAQTYSWDFGDGHIIPGNDTVAIHQYKSAGVYKPSIIVTDIRGCMAISQTRETIIIDSLFIALQHVPSQICAPKEVLLEPTIIHIGGDGSPPPLTYEWNFGAGDPGDVSNLRSPVFGFEKPGNYGINLKVTSIAGCTKETTATMVAYQGLSPVINAPEAVCVGSAVQFSASTRIAGTAEWTWIFEDGSISNQPDPATRYYAQAGQHRVQLIADNQGCSDTVIHTLRVNPKPMVGLTTRSATLCQGSTFSVTASGGSLYEWTSTTGIPAAQGPTLIASATNDIVYLAHVTDSNGCTQKDSVRISVVLPFKLQMAKEASICDGEHLQLSASGGDLFQWVGNTEGLSHTNIKNPTASPKTNAIYTLTARDQYNCFTDTSSISITVHPRPSVFAGTGAEVLAGSPFQLQATGSPDVVDWTWSPARYLNCIHCTSPVTTPMESITYTLSGKNTHGCLATDTISISLFCNAGRIFIPNAFSPNGDGLNDYFSVLGQGISRIDHFRIYDRWGKLVFERSDFSPEDKNGRWDGRYKGEPVPVGIYSYIVEMSCKGKTYAQKGSVNVLR